ncbi:hypothetical protein BU23DRAFT_569347 [Bimuria novae-zelandiae CBS 107.79]|uniref:Uncharacterized protein n=1 Tax=Bimuria novae-zelandiae CBS 107.79 TaxID=1447943 RepID=A0A6A5VAT1_9PLEO|nr:hypothetical protein BU23DRAFT_569347 [Bimuria novae-zelandiae CBS 107.79]
MALPLCCPKLAKAIMVNCLDTVSFHENNIRSHKNAFNMPNSVCYTTLDLTAVATWPIISEYDSAIVPYGPDLWCEHVSAMSSMTPDHLGEMWRFKRDRRGEQIVDPFSVADLALSRSMNFEIDVEPRKIERAGKRLNNCNYHGYCTSLLTFRDSRKLPGWRKNKAEGYGGPQRRQKNDTGEPHQLKEIREYLEHIGFGDGLALLPQDCCFEEVQFTPTKESKAYQHHNKWLLIGGDSLCQIWAYLRQCVDEDRNEIIIARETQHLLAEVRGSQLETLPMKAPFDIFEMKLKMWTRQGGSNASQQTLKYLIRLLFLVNGMEDRAFTCESAHAHKVVVRALRHLESARRVPIAEQSQVRPPTSRTTQAAPRQMSTTRGAPLVPAAHTRITTPGSSQGPINLDPRSPINERAVRLKKETPDADQLTRIKSSVVEEGRQVTSNARGFERSITPELLQGRI